MKAVGNGFKYFLNDEQVKDFDTFENKIKNIDVTIKVEGLNIYARTEKK